MATVGEKQQRLTDQTRVVVNNEASIDYERARDAAKFFSSNDLIPQLYTLVDATPCAINERPESDGTINLGVRTGSEELCTISLDEPTDIPVAIEDRVTGVFTILTSADSYTFTSRAGNDDSRFVLHVGAGATGISTHVISPVGDGNSFNLQGQPVEKSYKGLVIKNGNIIIQNQR